MENAWKMPQLSHNSSRCLDGERCQGFPTKATSNSWLPHELLFLKVSCPIIPLKKVSMFSCLPGDYTPSWHAWSPGFSPWNCCISGIFRWMSLEAMAVDAVGTGDGEQPIKLLVPIHKLKTKTRPSRTVRLTKRALSYGDTSFKYMVPAYRDTDTRLTFNCRRSSLAKMSKRDSSKIAAPQSTPLRLGCRNSPKTLRQKQRRFPSRSPSPVTWRFSHRN